MLVHLCAKKFKKNIYASDADGNVLFGKDLTIVNGVESNSDQHSPILDGRMMVIRFFRTDTQEGMVM